MNINQLVTGQTLYGVELLYKAGKVAESRHFTATVLAVDKDAKTVRTADGIDFVHDRPGDPYLLRNDIRTAYTENKSAFTTVSFLFETEQRSDDYDERQGLIRAIRSKMTSPETVRALSNDRLRQILEIISCSEETP